MKYNVLFLVSSFSSRNTGVGGHYRSVKTIAESLSNYHSVAIVTVGDLASPVFQGMERFEHIESLGLTDRISISNLQKVVARLTVADRPTILIAVGDLLSYLYCSLIAAKNSKIAYLKPGGRPIRMTFVFDKIPLIVFHRKDFHAFYLRDESRSIFLVNARVSPPRSEEKYLDDLCAIWPNRKSFRRVMTVCRFSSDKRRPLEIIYEKVRDVDLIDFCHVGLISDSDLRQDLNKSAPDFLQITDYEFTRNAATAIYSCDVFCGIGRAALEAIAIGKPCFVPIYIDGYPELVQVTPSTWRGFASNNFTHRTKIKDFTNEFDVTFISEVNNNFEKITKDADAMESIYRLELSPQGQVSRWNEFLDGLPFYRKFWTHEIIRWSFYIVFNFLRWVLPRSSISIIKQYVNK